MEAHRDLVILSCVGAYLVLCMAVGIWAMRRTNSAHDFFMAGRGLGVLVTGMAIFSTTLSGFAFVGGPGLVYAMGTSSLWIIITSSMGFALSSFLIAKRLRLFAELCDTASLPDAVAARYGAESTRLLTAIAILLGVMGYLATQLLAMATVLQSLLEGTVVDAISLHACVFISLAVLVFYCVTGGILASVYTDVVQGFVMIVGGVLVFLAAMASMDGGPVEMVQTIMADDREAMSPWGTLGMLGCLSWYFLFVIGGTGQPHIITKNMMVRRVSDLRSVLPTSIVGYFFSALLWIAIGIAMRALVLSGQHPELSAADTAAAVFLQVFTHPLLAGVVFAGLFAAIMSTGDAFLNIGAAALVHDIPKALRGRVPQNELFWARVATVVLALVAGGFALYSHYQNERMVAILGAFGWGTFGAALAPTVAIGFNWKRASALAANVAILSSLAFNLGVEVFDVAIPYGVSGGAVSLLLSLVLFFTISYARPPKPLDPDIEAVMDL
ncbi:MAG: hypothetical protein AAGM22_00230 [Acidobacteriota bacterium]